MIDYISLLKQGLNLTEEQSYACLNSIFNNNYDEVEIQQLLTYMSEKGETVDEIVGFARAMQEAAIPVTLNPPVIDLCGTGGSGKNRFNISTASAFVCAALGVPVAKHGNYGSKQPNGSFNFLEALNISFGQSPEELTKIYNQHKLCFIFARNHHPAMKTVAVARQALGKRTIFNLLGPLCNPASVSHQVMGTTSEGIAKKMAESLLRLGIQRALIVVGGDGRDELSIEGENIIFDVQAHNITRSTMSFNEVNESINAASYESGDAAFNASLFQRLIEGQLSQNPVLHHIAFNAGAALYCFGKTSTIKDGYQSALSAFFDKKVLTFIKNF